MPLPLAYLKFLILGFVLTLELTTAAIAQEAEVSIDTSPSGHQQIIDGFGTCTYSGTLSGWYSNLYFDDMYCSMVRVDLSPNFIAPYSDNSYNSPSYGNPGDDGNYVRTYTGVTGSEPYTRSYNGTNAQIAVMSAPVDGNIDANIAKLVFTGQNMAIAGQLAQIGQRSKRAQLGDFKLFGSIWSPAPWVKISSGNTMSAGGTFANGPAPGTPFPFIWLGNYAGGLLDVSGTTFSDFFDGTENTSALTQYARTVSASLRGFQNFYGVKFYAISIQNELAFEEFYNSCLYSNSSQYIAALLAVRAELDKYPDLKNILIEGPEDVLGGDQYGMWQYGSGATAGDKNLKFITDVESDPEAAAALGFYSIHGYDGNGVTANGAANPTSWDWWANGWTSSLPGIPSTVDGFTHYEKKSWMTETSGETSGWLDSSNGTFPNSGAFSIAVKMYQGLTTGRESAWNYWQFNDGTTPADAASLTDSTNLALAPKYVAAKHFMRFIRPNSYRVDTVVSGPSNSNILATSFVNDAQNSLTIVLINTSSSGTSIPVKVNIPGEPAGITYLNAFLSSNGNYWKGSRLNVVNGKVSISLPAYSVATLTNLPIAEPPAVSVPPGNYGSPVSFTVTQPNPGTTIYYTTDGSNPISSNTRQILTSGGTLTLNQSTALQFTVLLGNLYTDVVSYDYSIGADAPTVVSAVSTLDHGSAGSYSLSLALTGTATIEPRKGSSAGTYSIMTTFSGAVSNLTATLQLQPGQTGSVVGSAGTPSYDSTNKIVTVPLTGVGNAQRLNLHLSGITPGNGMVDIPINILWGKVNGSGPVNMGDALMINSKAGSALTNTSCIYDINGDGQINTGDALLSRSLLNTTLP